jgi:hypothetical protein
MVLLLAESFHSWGVTPLQVAAVTVIAATAAVADSKRSCSSSTTSITLSVEW